MQMFAAALSCEWKFGRINLMPGKSERPRFELRKNGPGTDGKGTSSTRAGCNRLRLRQLYAQAAHEKGAQLIELSARYPEQKMVEFESSDWWEVRGDP
jgi:hypothetical protein